MGSPDKLCQAEWCYERERSSGSAVPRTRNCREVRVRTAAGSSADVIHGLAGSPCLLVKSVLNLNDREEISALLSSPHKCTHLYLLHREDHADPAASIVSTRPFVTLLRRPPAIDTRGPARPHLQNHGIPVRVIASSFLTHEATTRPVTYPDLANVKQKKR